MTQPTDARTEALRWSLHLLASAGIRPTRLWVFGQHPDCDVQVVDDYVANFHAIAYRTADGSIWIADIGSLNGTWHKTVGGVFAQLDGPARLRPGDTVRIGRTELPWTASHERTTTP